jgi:hypothetical protein
MQPPLRRNALAEKEFPSHFSLYTPPARQVPQRPAAAGEQKLLFRKLPRQGQRRYVAVARLIQLRLAPEKAKRRLSAEAVKFSSFTSPVSIRALRI